ncbi:uncharacterized protein LOC110030760 [Phalaenopsis equestris]|uniref:uncharacterized protein LOC110030760 n=1 Tax=Phalaenopsis equestris TaxID=78828 RepID=UPI0009E2B5CB|nr:uncharacterized protein LOC110030760 [Phalaenopsis equestris]XP_020589331.1 uncharacterized protein LOC110030760 [Phalaenopsis equestris]XP_020589337.1 uncharacterized protein LOC110030760 [Phalaenopsis equestris]XP_020589345.1 uncharacterized protein LOC110030760 [Phalaenopsis equestris]
MAKKSHKLLTRWRKENIGCMWGLISIFDFRRGRSTQRLLSDKKCGSSRNLGIRYTRNKVGLPCNINESDGDVGSITHISDTEAESNAGSFDMPRKKELSRAHYSRRDFDSKLEWIKAEFGIGVNPEKNNKEATMNGAVGFENNLISSPSSISQQSDYPSVSTIHSSELKLGEFMLEFCNSGLYCKRKQSEFENKTDNVSVSILEKAIVDLTEAFLRENSNNLSQNIEFHQPKGIVDVLEMLNLNKELFFKLLQDPNSPIRKHIQELQNVQLSSKSFESNQKKLLGESKKFQKQNEGDDVKGPNKIVVLKPAKMRNQKLSYTVAPTASIRSLCNIGNEEGGERSSSHFSLKEFRKRFRNVIGTSKKEKHRIAMDGIMHNIPYGEQISRKNENFCRRDQTKHGEQRRSDTKEIRKKCEFSIASQTAGREKLSKNAAFCDEAKRHLAEFLRIGSENESSSPVLVSKSLGRILSFPGFDYSSPRHNLVREKEAESLQKQTSSLLYHSRQRNSTENLDLLRSIESFPNTDKIQEDEKEIMEIVGTKDNECIQIEDDLLGGTIKEETPMLLEPEQEAIFEISTPSTPIPLSSVTLQEPNDTDCTAEKAGRPSPISVLEPDTFEDINTPTSLIRQHEKAAIVETQTQLKGCQIGNSAAASGEADSEEDGLKCTEFNEALLFDELEVSYGLFFDDPKLLFDSIDEVLTEMKERHFGCSPWVSSMKSTIWSTPELKYFRKKASGRLNWNLDLQFPSTLKQAVEKDLEGRVWFDFQFEADGAAGEIADVIFEYLVEETALELWD